MITTQDSTEDWLSEIMEDKSFIHYSCGIEADPADGFGDCTCHVSKELAEAKAKIRQHMLSEALELIGEDEIYPVENYSTLKIKTRNELRAELRKAFTEKYGERE